MYQPCLASPRLQVGEFQIAPGLDLFPDELVVIPVGYLVEEDRAVLVAHAQHAVVEFEAAVGANERHQARAEEAELRIFALIGGGELFGEIDRSLRPGDHLVGFSEDRVALRFREQLVDAARDRARSVHTLAGGVTDDLLPPFAQQDALARHLGVFLGDRDDVATADLGVEAEE